VQERRPVRRRRIGKRPETATAEPQQGRHAPARKVGRAKYHHVQIIKPQKSVGFIPQPAINSALRAMLVSP